MPQNKSLKHSKPSYEQKGFKNKVKKIAKTMRKSHGNREQRITILQNEWNKTFDEDITYRVARSMLKHVKGFKKPTTSSKTQKHKPQKHKSHKRKSKTHRGKTMKHKVKQSGGGLGFDAASPGDYNDAHIGKLAGLPEGAVSGFTQVHHPGFPIVSLPKPEDYPVDTTQPQALLNVA